MGLAASQARLLFLTARLSDLELRAQTISNSKIRLANESKSASDEYCRALDQKKFRVQNGVDKNGATFADATVNNLVSYGTPLTSSGSNNKYRYITNNAGQLVIGQKDYDEVWKYGSRDEYMEAMKVPKNKDGSFDTSQDAYKYYEKIWDATDGTDYYHPNSAEVISDDQAGDSTWLNSQVGAGSIRLVEYDTKEKKFQDVSWESGDSTIQEVEDEKDIARAEANYNRTMADIQAKDKRFDLQLKQIDTEHTATQTTIDSVKKVIEKDIDRNLKMFQA